MKIGIFSAQYLPNYGGVERYTFQLAVRAIAAGHEVSVITSARKGLPQAEKSPEGIQIFRLPAWQLMNGRFPVPKRNREFREMTGQLWRDGLDVCVVQARFYPLSLYALRQTKKRKIPALLIEHSSGHLQPEGKVAALAGHWYEHFGAFIVRQNCGHIYGVSENTCRWLTHVGLRSEGVFYNSVDISEIDRTVRQQRGNDWRAKLGLRQEDKIILFSGRLIPEKGVLNLIDAMRFVEDRKVCLLIAGDGPLLERVRSEECERIRVLGNLRHDEMIGLFSQADVYCLPTVYAEGFPTTLLEAAACRCTIVSTATSGVEELILSEAYGLILKDTKPETIAAALEKALSEPDWRRKAGEMLRKRVEDCFDWEITAHRVIQTLEELAGKQPGR